MTSEQSWLRVLFPWDGTEVPFNPPELATMIVLDRDADDDGVWRGTMEALRAHTHMRHATLQAALASLSRPLPAGGGLPRRPALVMRIPAARGATAFALATWTIRDDDGREVGAPCPG